MKKILSYLIVFVLGISITVGASYLYKASDIEYFNLNSETTNVEEALDELYDLNKIKYLIKDGVAQEGYSFEAKAVRPDVYGGIPQQPTISQGNGFIRMTNANQGTYITTTPINLKGYKGVVLKFKMVSFTNSVNQSILIGLSTNNTDQLNTDIYGYTHVQTPYTTRPVTLFIPIKDNKIPQYFSISFGFLTFDVYEAYLV